MTKPQGSRPTTPNRGPELLRNHPAFRHLSPQAFDARKSLFQFKSHRVGEPVISFGDPAGRVFFLLSGGVSVFHHSEEGAEIIVKLFRAPATFGLEESMGGLQMYLESVRSIEPSTIATASMLHLREWIASDGQLASVLLQDVTRRFCMAINHERTLAFGELEGRLADHFLNLLAYSKCAATSAASLPMRLTVAELARATGSVERSVRRIVSRWTRDGLISRKGRHFTVHSTRALQQLSLLGGIGLTYSMDMDWRAA